MANMRRKGSEKLDLVNKWISETGRKPLVINLAHRLGIRVYNADFGPSVSGLIIRDSYMGGKTGFAILVNQNHTKYRRNFSIAHLISHYILHEPDVNDKMYSDTIYRCGLRYDQEINARDFASNILIPLQKLNNAISEYGDDIKSLAKEFSTSESFVRARIGFRMFQKCWVE
jgi:Zn-dependent peptidase ImmA (M78 family)